MNKKLFDDSNKFHYYFNFDNVKLVRVKHYYFNFDNVKLVRVKLTNKFNFFFFFNYKKLDILIISKVLCKFFHI